MTLAFERWGDGPVAVVGLHGWNGSAQTFSPLVEHSGGRCLLAFDLPGFGNSSPPSELTVDAIVGPLEEHLVSHDAGNLTLIGSCAGSVWVMELALRIPDRIQRLVLVDPFAYVPWYFAMLSWPVLGWFFYWVSFAQPLGRWLTNRALESKRTGDTDLTADFSEVRHDVAHGVLRLLCAKPDLARFACLAEKRIDILVGENSFAAVHTSARMFQAIWPEAQVHELEGAGHLPIAEASVAVSQILFDSSGP